MCSFFPIFRRITWLVWVISLKIHIWIRFQITRFFLLNQHCWCWFILCWQKVKLLVFAELMLNQCPETFHSNWFHTVGCCITFVKLVSFDRNWIHSKFKHQNWLSISCCCTFLRSKAQYQSCTPETISSLTCCIFVEINRGIYRSDMEWNSKGKKKTTNDKH